MDAMASRNLAAVILYRSPPFLLRARTILMVLMGGIWILQGLNLAWGSLSRSFMQGDQHWVFYGATLLYTVPFLTRNTRVSGNPLCRTA
jgi:hypothetical protein